MENPQTVDPEIANEIKSILTGFETKMGGKFVTQDDAVNFRKEVEGKLTALAELKAECVAAIDTRAKEERSAMERFVKQSTAHGGPGILAPTDAEIKSLGSRFADTPEFKAWAASKDSRGRLNVTITGRIREGKAAGTITTPSSGYPVTALRVGHIEQPTLPLGVRDLLTVVSLSAPTNSIEYVIPTWEYAADYQLLEGDKKAQGNVTYVDKTAGVKTLAWYVKMSRQMLADVPYFASTVDSQLLYGLAKKEDHELLHGDGLAGHIHGLLPQASTLAADLLADIIYSADQVLAAIAYLRSLAFQPTAIVMNPMDWAAMQIQKTSQGVYILGGPPAASAATTLWGLPVLPNYEMTAGTFLVGDFPANAVLFDRESPSVDVATENEDDFVRNLVTMRCEERIAFAVYRPTAFVKGVIPPVVVLGASAPQREVRKKE